MDLLQSATEGTALRGRAVSPRRTGRSKPALTLAVAFAAAGLYERWATTSTRASAPLVTLTANDTTGNSSIVAGGQYSYHWSISSDGKLAAGSAPTATSQPQGK